jgi:hypothetical protein
MEQYLSFGDILSLILYLGSITFLAGLTYQLFVSIRTDTKFNLKQLFLVIVTRLLTISATLLIWFYWSTKVDIQLGPFLLPALIAELFISPILLKLFGYSMWVPKKAST